jgi:antitoxin (DNA-binding transcriptional repressor) of toxin-antitoxin stability system
MFKAECLKLMDEVARTGKPVVITKHGRPVAQLVPMPPAPGSLFGYMRNSVSIRGDVLAPIGESWRADSVADEPLVITAKRKSRARGASSRK